MSFGAFSISVWVIVTSYLCKKCHASDVIVDIKAIYSVILFEEVGEEPDNCEFFYLNHVVRNSHPVQRFSR